MRSALLSCMLALVLAPTTAGAQTTPDASPVAGAPDGNAAATTATPVVNLIPGGGFEPPAPGSPPPKSQSFLFHSIVGPSTATLTSEAPHAGAGACRIDTLPGGVAYLHSGAFDVEPGREYEFTAWARGAGAVRLECFWWRHYGLHAVAATRARDTGQASHSAAAAAAAATWREAGLKARAPKDASRAYLRVMVRSGPVWLDDLGAVASE